MKANNEREKLSLTQYNYNQNSINCQEIKRLNFWNYLENEFKTSYIKKKSSKYGRLYKTEFGVFWVRYDFYTKYYFYVNLKDDSDKGTLIDFIQNHILKENNLGKVKKYILTNMHLF